MSALARKLRKPRVQWRRKLKHERQSTEVLAAFVRDAEQDILSVVTTLQAHVDLLHDELERSNMPVTRFIVLNRAIARIATDITILTAFSDHVRLARSNQPQNVDELMKQIATETQAAFEVSQVSLDCNIAEGASLIGCPTSLKTMFTAMVLAVLHNAQESDTVTVIGKTHDRKLTLSVDTAGGKPRGVFDPWRLGELHLVPTNSDSISLAAIDAMARIHHGRLSVSTLGDSRHGYRLTFDARGN